MRVPKAAVNEDNLATTRQHDVRFAGEILFVKAEPVTHCMEQSAHDDFGSSVLVLDGLHDAPSLFGAACIHSQKLMVRGIAGKPGGPISLIDMVGVAEFVKECDILKQKYGAQFDVPKLLRDMADKGESFYGKTPAAQAA